MKVDRGQRKSKKPDLLRIGFEQGYLTTAGVRVNSWDMKSRGRWGTSTHPPSRFPPRRRCRPRPPAHVTADDFPRLERDDEKQIAAEQKERREERKEGRILVGFRIINKKRKKELEEMTEFSRNAAPTTISVPVACQQCL